MSIEILSPTLANQIAAGEVIERPASVVKELVENAIDAGSTQIDVIVKEAGLTQIKVIDNGSGIPAGEAERAFERHATSKISQNEDLFRIRTLGFRGEALPSIASVSELTLETSTGDGPGKRIHLKGGDVIENTAGHARKGTTVTVDQLFFNTPARLKYIKSIKTELAHIADVINRSALAHPEIAFRFEHDDSLYTKTSGNGDLKQAIAGIYGVSVAKKMRAIKGESFDFTVSGMVSLPELTRAGRQYITLIVNGRYVKSYALTNAIVKGYGSKLMIGRFPIAVIQIELDPLLLDVNVHPTKQEIRISKEDELVQLIAQSVNERMNQEVRIPYGLDSVQPKKEKDTTRSEQTDLFKNRPQEPLERNKQEDAAEETRSSSFASLEREDQETRHQTEERTFPFFIQEPDADNFQQLEPAETAALHEEDVIQTAKKQLNVHEKETSQETFPELDYIGQLHGTYLLAQNEDGFYMIDQHAAQERIRYEFYRKEIGERGTALQELLVPIMLDYPTNEALLIAEKMDILNEAGIYLEPFGQNSFLLRNHPSWFLSGQEEATVKEMIDFLLENQSLSTAAFREATAIMMSCKRSIKANHRLSDAEARQLLQDLPHAENPYNCPHGRPVMIQFTMYEIEKMFKRIQDR